MSTTTAASGSSGAGGGAAACLGSSLLGALGLSGVFVGASMSDTSASLAPFDAREKSLNGGLFDGAAPCAACDASCTSDQTSCAMGQCPWWGCWQNPKLTPGQYVIGFDGRALAQHQIPMWTYAEISQGTGLPPGPMQYLVPEDAQFLSRYFADFRFMLQRIGSAQALVNLEPGLWGYCQQANADPHAIFAAVKTSNPTDCGAAENSIAGMVACMVSMVRTYAPNAKVGLFASSDATGVDVLLNRDATLDPASEAQTLGAWLVAAGAGQTDFVVARMSNHDAGYDQSMGVDTWWDATNATLPSFHQAFTWAGALAEAVGKPIVWWQTPLGNAALPNKSGAWKDNRVDYLFAHLPEVAASHGVAVFFGAGPGGQTTPESDDGNLVTKVNVYATTGRTPACP